MWTTLQDASAGTLVRAQHLPVDGPQTADNATAYLNSLISSRCGAIFAVGRAPIDATAGIAAQHPTTRFVAVGGGAPMHGVTTIDPASPETLKEEIDKQLEALAEKAS